MSLSRTAHARGREGEDAAARFLLRKGYEILARNARAGRGEIDIVARKNGLLVFVEVKAHAEADRSLEAMHPDKQARILSAAEGWLSAHPELASLQCRFDLIILTRNRAFPRRLRGGAWTIEHMKDVIR